MKMAGVFCCWLIFRQPKKGGVLTFTKTFPVYAYTKERPGIHLGNSDLNIVNSNANDNSIRTGFFLIS